MPSAQYTAFTNIRRVPTCVKSVAAPSVVVNTRPPCGAGSRVHAIGIIGSFTAPSTAALAGSSDAVTAPRRIVVQPSGNGRRTR